MLQIDNETPFAVALIPSADRDDVEHATVVIKGTYALGDSTETLELAEEQVPIAWAEDFHGEPDSSSIKYEADTSPGKPGTDVVLVGNAYSPRPVEELDVSLRVAGLTKTVRVFGDRHWKRGIAGWSPSPAEPFEIMPLIFERAFGGADTSHSDPAKHAFESRNPVGCGFAVRRANLQDLPLPNLEDPAEPIRSWKAKPRPACFGFVARSWTPRRELAGTYDERWERERAPCLPADFDPLYFSAASAGLIATPYLSGGEPAQVLNASEAGELRFRVPSRRVGVEFTVRGKRSQHESVLDLLLIEPDARRVVVVWRASRPTPREFLYVDRIRVRDGGPS